jgi:hypothetical protein
LQRTALKESASSGCSRPITRNLNQSYAVQLPSKLKPTSRFEGPIYEANVASRAVLVLE